MIKITDEYLEKADDKETFDEELFNTEQEVEVRIPFTGYYSLKLKCKDQQVAMSYVLQATRYCGLDMRGIEEVIEDIEEDETYSVLV